MAAATNVKVRRERAQFQGIYSDMWLVTFRQNFDNVNSSSKTKDTETLTIPGIKKGDHVLGWGAWETGANGTGGEVMTQWTVINDDTLQGLIFYTFVSSGGSRDLAPLNMSVVIARPAFDTHENHPA